MSERTSVDTDVVELDDDPFADDLSDRLAAAAPRKVVTKTTVGLAAVLLLALGFVGGSLVQKNFGTPATATAANTGARTGAGFGGLGGAAPSAAPSRGGVSGTVKLVQGTTVYVQTAAGETVIVKTSGSTAVKVAQAGALKDLSTGAQVTVAGQAGADGVVTATEITTTR